MQDATDAIPPLPTATIVPPAPDSPALDSPDTPINNSTNVGVKIADLPETESDVRHEPIPIKIDKLDATLTLPEIGTPLDPASIPVAPPSGTPPPPPGESPSDVRAAEEVPAGLTGYEDVEMDDELAESSANGDVVKAEPAVNGEHEPMNTESEEPLATQSYANTPMSPPGGSSTTAVESASPNDDDAPLPPAKRVRKFSDAEQASAHQPVAHIAPSPPPRASGADNDSSARQSTFSVAQHKFAMSTIRTLKKLKDAAPFKLPVDPVALNIPHYFQVITHPMDFSTIEHKLNATNPIKPSADPSVPRYKNADEFIADVRLIFSNSVTFNGADHFVTQAGKRVESVFDKQIKQMPAPEEPKPTPVKKAATPPPPPPAPAPVIPKKAARRPSAAVPIIRRNDNDNVGRPKREIHPPPPKDLPYAEAPKKQRKRVAKKDGTGDQLRYCLKILDQLNRKQHSHVVLPFAEPVDWVKLQIPDYPRIIKKPMDLSTMRKKLDNGEYPSAERFRDDFKLIIHNCFMYNSPGTPVNQAGIELQRLFDEKWKDLPPLHPTPVSDDEEEEDEDDSEYERQKQIALMRQEIMTMESNIARLAGDIKTKKQKPAKKPKKNNGAEVYSPPIASSSKMTKKEVKAPQKKKPAKKAPPPDDDALSFEQKKDLSEAIQNLDGSKLEKVIQIIHEGMPNIRDSQDEIELEIDTLPSAVLTKLYNFVLRPVRQANNAKRNRTGKGTGTGGLKRKSMDEDQEAEKIRALEERMKLFDQPNGGDAPAPATNGHDSEHSTDDSSDDDSSDSE